ncbi:hypothetical protein [Cronobacter dublinensis]|uniref:hypothetical protein n=1 Tax=Cronobacter dublinensis TaxID=413497 RepID=UPI00131A2733|nr:hypothetical protein [Cronobacter dublinensis]
MTFSDVVLTLREHHPELWFNTGTSTPAVDVVRPWSWNSAAIFSAGGQRLASQAGSANEWKLEPGHKKPGLPPSKAGLHYCVELTDWDFQKAVCEIMS